MTRQNRHMYKDKRGYLRYKNTHELVHRAIAREEIYLKNRDKYPLPFEEYVVHHNDGNKLNNMPKNLQILTPPEHSEIHLDEDYTLPFEERWEIYEEMRDKVEKFEEEEHQKISMSKRKKFLIITSIFAIVMILSGIAYVKGHETGAMGVAFWAFLIWFFWGVIDLFGE